MKTAKQIVVVLFFLHLAVAVFAQPTITAFSPSSAKPGDVVTLTGTGFNTNPANNIVFFGATRGTVTAASATSLTVTVPVGATYGPISVLNINTTLIATSTPFFTPTFTPTLGSISTADIAAKIDFTTGTIPESVAMGDIDGDGKADLVIANVGANTISVLRNTSSSGTVSFAAKEDFAAGTSPRSIGIADLNGDGRPEVVVANGGSNNISVFLNQSNIGTLVLAPVYAFAAGNGPIGIAIGDINSDGRLDLVTANYNDHTISVLRNTATDAIPSFASPVSFTTDQGPISVAIGDIDGDGKPDVATANLVSGFLVSVLRNTSSGSTISFASKATIVTGTNPVSVAIGDINNDSKLDIVTANSLDNKVSVLRNTSSIGTIGFATKVDVVTGTDPNSIAIGDIDGDGKPDIVTANDDGNNTSILRNTSSGSTIAFVTNVNFAAGTRPWSVAIGDLDGDGKSDLAVANRNSNTVSVYRNTPQYATNANLSSLTTTAGTITPAFSATTTAYTVNVANGVTSTTVTPTVADATATVQVRVNNGSYVAVTSGTASGALSLNTGANPIDIRVTAQDGATMKTYTITVTRAVSTNADLSALTISSGTLSPSFASATTAYSATITNATSSITVTPTRAEANATIQVRVNGGGYTTVTSGVATSALSMNVGTNTVDVRVTAQDGTTIKTYTITVTRISNNADLSALTISSGTLSPVFSTNTTAYVASVSFTTSSITVTPTKTEANGTIQVRVNGGSYATVTSGAASGALTMSVGSNTVNILVTAQDGTTTKTYTITVTRIAPPTITSFSPLSAKPGDAVTITGTNFNTTTTNNIVFFGATRATVSAATATSLTVTVPAGATYAPITLLNTGTSLFTASRNPFTPAFNPSKTGITATDFLAKVDFASGTNPIAVAVGDLDGDGKLDLVALNTASNSISIYRNTATSGEIATGSFASRVDFAAGAAPRTVAIGDVDADGKPDLVVTNGEHKVCVLRNTATSGSITAGSFAAKVDFSTGLIPESVSIGDIDGDGKPELVVSNVYDNTISVFQNTSTSGSITTGSFANKVDFATGSEPYAVAISDIDGDGKLDIAVANRLSSTLSVFRNTATAGSITSGSLATKVDFSTASGPRSIAVGDLDGDGKPDVAVVNSTSTSVSIYRNTATSGSITSGSLAAKVDFTTNNAPQSVMISDLNGDGKPDVATANYSVNTISIFRNTSTSGSITTGSFETKIDFANGTPSTALAIGDLDGDGRPDIAATSYTANTIAVLRNTSNNADLSTLTISSGTLSPGFAAATTAYTAITNASSITVTPTKADVNATIQVQVNNGGYTTVVSGNASAALPLNLGTNTIDIRVTAQDGITIKTYTITVTKLTSLDLVGLSSSAASVVYSLRKISTEYTGNAIQVRRSSDNATQNIGFSGNNLDTSALKTFVGSGNGFVTIWYDQSGYGRNLTQPTTSKQPQIVASGTIHRRNFRPTTFYDATDDGMLFSGSNYLTSNPLSVNIVAGSNGNNVIFRRAVQGTLTSNWLIGPYNNQHSWFANGWNHQVSTPWSLTSVEIFTVIQPASGSCTSWRNGVTQTTANNRGLPNILQTGSEGYSEPLNGYISEIVAISAALGTTDRESLEANQTSYYSNSLLSTDANLTALTTTAGAISPTFNSNTTAYTVNVTNATTSVTVTPTKSNTNAKIEVRVNSGSYATVTSGNASAALSLNVGSNTIDVRVTAENETTTKTYTITVTRAASNNTDLSAMAISTSTLSPSFAAATTAYTTSIGGETASITVTPTVAEANATISVRVNGGSYATVANGNASAALALNVGVNTINVRVIAQDGTTTKIYTITATKSAMVITSFNPISGKPGDAITITGTDFNTTAANNAVYFGATRASVSAATATSLNVTVPTGATHAPITVLSTASGLAAYSPQNFTPSFSPAKSNIATGDFLPEQGFAAGQNPSSSAVGDLDGDGKPDLIIGYSNSSIISIFRNTSTSGSIDSNSFANRVDIITPGVVQSIAINDLDGNGKLDIVVTNFIAASTGRTSIFLNIGTSGNISANSFAARIDLTNVSFPGQVKISDLDGDGRLDLAITDNSFNTVSILRNTSTSGSISENSFAPKVDFATGSGPFSLSIDDMDGDGKPDLLVTNYYSNTFSIFRNTATIGSFSTSSFASRVDFSVGGAFPTNITTGDLDGDGKKDLVVGYSRTFSVFRNTATVGVINSSSFASKVDFSLGFFNPDEIALSDLTGDGKIDVIIRLMNSISVFRNTATSGSFTTSNLANKTDFVLYAGAAGLLIADLDGDSKPDMLTVNRLSSYISVFRNTYNVDLSALTLSAGTLSPAFATNTVSYSAVVGLATTSITVTPTKSNSNATIGVRVNGGSYTTVTSGNASQTLALNVGSNTIEILVTAQDGTTTKTYTVTVSRLSTNADLSNLTTTAGALNPSFAANTTAYTTPNVSMATTSITVTPTKADANASIEVRINGGSYATVTSGNASNALALNGGSNAIEIRVTAEDGTTTKTYTITVVKPLNTLDFVGLSSGTASVAYGLRKLSSDYTGNAIQVRRSSDDATQDIGFSGNNLDTAALKTFVGSGNGFVSIWYDQSGSGRHLTQAAAYKQPQIVNDGVIIRRNYRPTTFYDITDDGMLFSGSNYLSNNPLTVNLVAGSNSNIVGTRRAIQGSNNWLIGPYGNQHAWFAGDWNHLITSPWSLTTVEIFTVTQPTSGACGSWRNGVAQTTANNVGVPNKIYTGAEGGYAEAMDGYISEILAFNTVLGTTDRESLEANQASYFALSSDATLAALTTAAGNLNPAFNVNTTAYSAAVNHATTSITVTPTTSNANASIEVRINGGSYATVTSGNASAALDLNVGTNTIDIKVTAENQTTVNIYTLTVTRGTVTWVGTTSTAWSTASNWNTNEVPNVNDRVIIPAGTSHAPNNSGSITIVALNIAANVTLTNSGTIQVTETLSNNGTITGTVVLNGTSAQTIEGSGVLTHLTLNNASGATITSGSTAITGTYTPTLGLLTTNGNLVLKSSAGGTARIATGSGNYITGDVRVERYLPNTGRKWRLLTSPVTGLSNNSIFFNWQNNGTVLSGVGAEIWGSSGTCIPGSTAGNGLLPNPSGAASSMRKYNSSTNSWDNVTNTTAETLFNNTTNKAFALFVTGHFGGNYAAVAAGSAATTLSATGSLITGTHTVNFSYEDNDEHVAFIANPYASPVNFFNLTRNNIIDKFWVWDPNLDGTGGYVLLTGNGNGDYTPSVESSYSSSTAAGTVYEEIQSGQAFFVQAANPGAASITFNEDDKVSTTHTQVFRNGNTTERLRINLLNAANPATIKVVDGVLVQYNNSYSNDHGSEDGIKLYNDRENFWIAANGKEYMVEGRKLIDNADTIRLVSWALQQQAYRLEIIGSNFAVDANLSAYLRDKYLGTETAISLSGTVEYPFTVTSDVNSKAIDRFMVVFRSNASLPVVLTNVKAYQQSTSIHVEWNTQSESHIKHFEIEKSSNGIHFTTVNTTAAKSGTTNIYKWIDATPYNGNNYYRIKAISQNGEVKFSNIVVVRLHTKAAVVNIYPNPVKGNNINLALSGLDIGNYTINLYNQLGQLVFTKNMYLQSNNVTQTLQLGKLIAGVYELQLSNGKTLITQKIIKE